MIAPNDFGPHFWFEVKFLDYLLDRLLKCGATLRFIQYLFRCAFSYFNLVLTSKCYFSMITC